VFAAGNLLRGAETADTCALEGARSAEHIRAYLRDGQWPAAGLAMQVESPIAWIYPNVVGRPTAGPVARDFWLRVQTFCENVRVIVKQGEAELFAQSFRRLGPNDSFRLSGRWLPAVDAAGPALRVGLRPV
jgi:hypothetical protein